MSESSKRVRIEYPAGPASQPVLYPLSHEHDVRINIRRAEIAEDGGFLEVEMAGGEAAIAAVCAALRAEGCTVVEDGVDEAPSTADE